MDTNNQLGATMIRKLAAIIVLSFAFAGTASADALDDWNAANHKASRHFAGKIGDCRYRKTIETCSLSKLLVKDIVPAVVNFAYEGLELHRPYSAVKFLGELIASCNDKVIFSSWKSKWIAYSRAF